MRRFFSTDSATEPVLVPFFSADCGAIHSSTPSPGHCDGENSLGVFVACTGTLHFSLWVPECKEREKPRHANNSSRGDNFSCCWWLQLDTPGPHCCVTLAPERAHFIHVHVFTSGCERSGGSRRPEAWLYFSPADARTLLKNTRVKGPHPRLPPSLPRLACLGNKTWKCANNVCMSGFGRRAIICSSRGGATRRVLAGQTVDWEST